MRKLLPLVLSIWVALLLVACATPHSVAPREYLDEKTAATITVVADPWVLASERTAQNEERDFLNLYAIDVNRMGEHRQYLAVLQWWPTPEAESGKVTPALQLHAADRTITLNPTTEDARSLGIAQPVAQTMTALDSKWWYFPVNKEALADIAKSPDLRATLVVGSARTSFTKWRDGRAELIELTDALP
jgi:hypothetical protein